MQISFSVKILGAKTIDELEGSWTDTDFVELLKRFDYEDAEKLKPAELKDYLFMAISDFEPAEAASILLDYKLSEALNEGQIDNISQEMLREKVSENYSDIYIHHDLFNVNQLLYKAYNGKFHYTKAVLVDFELKTEDDQPEITKEIVLKVLSKGLSDSNLINRLFGDQLDGEAPFPEAEGILWDLVQKENQQYTAVTSEKWLVKEDFEALEYTCEISPSVDADENE